MSKMKKVLVFGATGQQGGAVVKALQQAGHEIIGLTRNANSEKAKALSVTGVDIREGNFHSANELVDLMKEVDTVFSLTTPFEDGPERETEQGKTTAEAAAKARVKHFVYNSVSDADKATGIPHFDSKYRVEQHIIELGLPYTIVAPVYFMDNLVSPWTMEMVKNGNISLAMPDDRALQQIAVKDIAQFVATVITRSENFIDKRINIAGDELNGNQMVEILESITGKKFLFEGYSPDVLRESSEDMALMLEWFDRVGYSADIEKLKKDFPEVQLASFEAYARGIDWSFMN